MNNQTQTETLGAKLAEVRCGGRSVELREPRPDHDGAVIDLCIASFVTAGAGKRCFCALRRSQVRALHVALTAVVEALDARPDEGAPTELEAPR